MIKHLSSKVNLQLLLYLFFLLILLKGCAEQYQVVKPLAIFEKILLLFENEGIYHYYYLTSLLIYNQRHLKTIYKNMSLSIPSVDHNKTLVPS